MKAFVIIAALLSLSGTPSSAHAEETVSEKAISLGKDTKRALKKAANRVEEGLCGKLTGDSKLSCMAKEAKNRVAETADLVVDKATETKDTID